MKNGEIRKLDIPFEVSLPLPPATTPKPVIVVSEPLDVSGKLAQCQICIGYPLTSQSDPKGPGTSKLGWRYFEHYKVDRN